MDEVLTLAFESPIPELKEETPEVLAAVPPLPLAEQRPHQ
jgi:hypothetical protein